MGEDDAEIRSAVRRLAAEEALGEDAPYLLTERHRVGGGPRPASQVDDAELARRREAVLAFRPAGALSRPVAPPPVPAIPEGADLRGLVAEIVREELRGALGERITRNVRRMVRQEIETELAARALERPAPED